MSILNQIAYFQNRRDEVPNQELARALVENQDRQGIQEIASNLWNENQNIQSDCLKVLYEIGYLKPELIADYSADFLKLLKCKNNRMVWGGMIALSTIAALKADEIAPHVEEVKHHMEQGSVITMDNGVKILAVIASKKEEYHKEISQYLLKFLEICRPKDLPRHAENSLVSMQSDSIENFIGILEKRMPELTDSQSARLKKVIKTARASR